jgi:hypothetical protein
MQPYIWGRYLWSSIHYIALGYPDIPSETDIINYYNFFSNLWQVIPCYKCSLNYKNHLKELPIDSYLSSKMKLFEWTVLVHNIVNKELGKKQLSVEDALNILTKDNQFYFKNNLYIYYSILLAIIIALLIYILIKTKRSWV